MINPPAKNKRNYWAHDPAGAPGDGGGPAHPDADPDRWFETAERIPGSWWPAWIDWLAPHSGTRLAARKRLGNGEFEPFEDAPGSYVKQKAP